jgi:hypothetical protein
MTRNWLSKLLFDESSYLNRKTEATNIKEDAKNGEIKVGGEEFVLQATEDVTETNASHSDDVCYI